MQFDFSVANDNVQSSTVCMMEVVWTWTCYIAWIVMSLWHCMTAASNRNLQKQKMKHMFCTTTITCQKLPVAWGGRPAWDLEQLTLVMNVYLMCPHMHTSTLIIWECLYKHTWNRIQTLVLWGKSEFYSMCSHIQLFIFSHNLACPIASNKSFGTMFYIHCIHNLRRTSHTIVYSIVAIKWLQIIPYTTSRREGSHC